MVESIIGPYQNLTATSQKKENIVWRGMKVSFKFFYESPLMIVGILISAVVSYFFFPVLTPTLLALASATFFSKLLIKVLNICHCKYAIILERGAWAIKNRYKYIQLILLGGTLVSGYFIPFVGVSLAIVLGIYNGLICEIDYCKKMQVVAEYQSNHREMEEIMNIVSI